ncbi:MAG: hypothetical protein LC100_02430 [Chitinophagales bacterium]|nr:hypothetical protein [Chitinophagales bacterium]
MPDDKKLWTPSEAFKTHSNLSKYADWLKAKYQLSFSDYHSLWKWSVDRPADFWESIAVYFDVRFHTPYEEVMSPQPMPHTQWFKGATLNYAAHVFRNSTPERPAIRYASETGGLKSLSWAALEQQTAALQTYFRESGVQQGDRVVAYIPIYLKPPWRYSRLSHWELYGVAAHPILAPGAYSIASGKLPLKYLSR